MQEKFIICNGEILLLADKLSFEYFEDQLFMLAQIDHVFDCSIIIWQAFQQHISLVDSLELSALDIL